MVSIPSAPLAGLMVEQCATQLSGRGEDALNLKVNGNPSS